jgi:hypothetical protein
MTAVTMVTTALTKVMIGFTRPTPVSSVDAAVFWLVDLIRLHQDRGEVMELVVGSADRRDHIE